jgi:hypothetical protein
MSKQEELVPRAASSEEVLEILRSRRFDSLLGILESEDLEFKRQPYLLDTASQKYLFVEDMVSFANHNGGLIVIGCETTKYPNVEGDFVNRLRPVSKAHCNLESYRSLCNEFIYPLLKGVQWFYIGVEGDNDASGYIAIKIPPAGNADKPHLVNHVVSEGNDRKTTTHYALTQRTGSRNSSYPVQSVHGLIKLGSASQALQAELLSLSQRLEKIEDLLQPANQSGNRSLSNNRRRFLEQVGKFLEATGLQMRPTLVLGAYPSQNLTVEGLFDSHSPVGRAFDTAPELRPNGFGFTLDQRSEIVDGVARRIFVKGYKARQLTARGSLLVAVPADEDFLAFFQRRREGQPICYRSYILAEVSYLFARYTKNIFGVLSRPPQHLDIMVALRNCFVDGLAPQLYVARDHQPMHWSFEAPRSVPKMNVLKTVRVPSSISTERLAFEVQAGLYRRLGFGDELVPYATLEAEGRITTEDEILNPARA